MYEQHFGLTEKPFSLTPDTEFFFRFSSHLDAMQVLLFAISQGEGFVRVIGEVGTGKTLLCRKLLKIIEKKRTTAYLPNPLLTPQELYQAIYSELKLPAIENATVQQLGQGLLVELIRLYKKGRPLVILIDEAQAIPYRTLEALRLLSNLETEKVKLLQIVFFAQPEFEERLADASLRQLRQRISFSCQLKMLSREEIPRYLDHRLRVAGFKGGAVFSSSAARLLHHAGKGVPRLINQLANKAMLVAYGKGQRTVGWRYVLRAARDTGGVSLGWPILRLPKPVEFVTVTLVAVLTFMVLEGLR